jgi:hypothetical protein
VEYQGKVLQVYIIPIINVSLRGMSKKFGEWYQKTNKTEDTNKLTPYSADLAPADARLAE